MMSVAAARFCIYRREELCVAQSACGEAQHEHISNVQRLVHPVRGIARLARMVPRCDAGVSTAAVGWRHSCRNVNRPQSGCWNVYVKV
jgi:hypothetical protein